MTFRTWRLVTDIGRTEASYEPPDSLVRWARALYPQQWRQKPKSRSVQVAALIFDSFREPLPVGVRTLAQPTRQLYFMAANYYVDLRIEGGRAAGPASLVGQVLSHPAASQTFSVEKLPVTLSSGKASLAHTVTNNLGEFHFELDSRKSHHISIVVSEELALVVPLRGQRDT